MKTALALFEELGDQAGQASIYIQLGGMLDRQSQPADALPHGLQALAHYRAIGNRLGQAAALNNIGWYYSLELRAGYAEGVIYGHLGDICLAKGDTEDARAQYQQAVAIFDQLGRADAAEVRAKLAELAEAESPAPVRSGQ